MQDIFTFIYTLLAKKKIWDLKDLLFVLNILMIEFMNLFRRQMTPESTGTDMLVKLILTYKFEQTRYAVYPVSWSRCILGT